MFIFFLWIASIVVTLVIANNKKLSTISFFFLALLTGPLAIFIALVDSSPKGEITGTLGEARRQLDDLKNSMLDLQNRAVRVELLINKLIEQEDVSQTQKLEKDKIDKEDAGAVLSRAESGEAFAPVKKSSGMELDFGRYWLNKIGIVVFTLGLGFLISYTFNYFGPVLKISGGYLISVVLFIFGLRLETKEKFVRFGRVLLGGGWALVYITTYAMHHFPASRIIDSQVLDLCLLAIVVVGMMLHVLRYKSEEMMSVALLVAYVTATLGQITSFTVISCLLLATLILFLVYHFQWIKTFILGVIVTYGIHCSWVAPNITSSVRQPIFFNIAVADYGLLMNFLFLTAYWLVFLAGTHVARIFKDDKLVRTLAAANFGNIASYSVLAYPLVLKLFYGQRFSIVLFVGVLYLALALAMKKIGRQKLYVSDIVAAIFMITFSIPLKFLPTSALLIWLIEAPFLLFIGLNFKEKIFRYLSYALAIFIALRLIFLCSFEHMANIHFLGLTWQWAEFMSLWASISMAGCFYLTQRAKSNIDFDDKDHIFDQVFSAASGIYLTLLLLSMIKQPWLTFALSVEGLALLVVSVFLGLRRFRAYSYLVLGIAALNFMGESIYAPSKIFKWFLISADVIIFFVVYFVFKYVDQVKKLELFFENERTLAFWAGIILLVSAIFQYVNSQWISLSLGIAGVLIILIGILDSNKTERLGGLLLLGLTLGRVIFVDLSGMEVIFKIITFIALGILFVGVSFVYNRFNIAQEKREDGQKT